ncbi:hypothetical protein CAC42_228 [Sphaceloma murrayae]|uniref:ER-bound oxygenase mpaB/mpaB'/Rubber oxygenase catalytic domain-containing protein n=1 Tax=Sphaceloma murrayae TaxID=2082308 RepID=A0A2K1QMY2_9PEZI|nr:hypothetical protein CAC42_228 [Sphaceloma murrayae]
MTLTLPYIIVPVVLLYIVLQRHLRFRRRDALTSRFPTRASLSQMTLSQAFDIHYTLNAIEFPTTIYQSIFFALFKTYGIPSISRLLLATTQLSSPRTASKRAADTGVLLTELFLLPPDSPRVIAAFARVNYLHSSYRKAGKITNDDMLYTLSLFVLEPVRWVQRFEWRELSEVERAAMGMYWRWVGEGLGVDFAPVKEVTTTTTTTTEEGKAEGKEGKEGKWRDGLEFLRDLERWSTRYEERAMVPAQSNAEVARGTTAILLTNVPERWRGAAEEAIKATMEPRLRRAMMFEEPTARAVWWMGMVLGLRKWVVGHLMLPRPEWMRWVWFEGPDEAGRYHATQWTDHPWYVKPTWGRRWSFNAVLLKMVGGKLPGDDGDRFLPGGYKIPEVGPDYQKGKGGKEMEEDMAKLAGRTSSGCPFAAW